jgi:hypothetical protein
MTRLENGKNEFSRVETGAGCFSGVSAPVSLEMKSLSLSTSVYVETSHSKTHTISACSEYVKVASSSRCCSLAISCVHLETWASSSASSCSSLAFSCFLLSISGFGGCRFVSVTSWVSTCSTWTCRARCGSLTAVFEGRGDCLVGPLTRGGLLLGEENKMPRRGASCPSMPLCDGVNGKSGSLSSPRCAPFTFCREGIVARSSPAFPCAS